MKESLQILQTPVQYLKGVGPYVASLLDKLGIKTLEDLLYHLPERYLDRQKIGKISALQPGPQQVVEAELAAFGEVPLGRSRRKIFEAVFSDGTGLLHAKWFNYYSKSMAKQFKIGKRAVLCGDVEFYRNEKQMIHPELEWQGEEEKSEGIAHQAVVPVYPLTEGLSQKTLRKIVAAALEKASGHLLETLPAFLLNRLGLPSYEEALKALHFPPEGDVRRFNEKSSPAHQRIIFDEFFFLELGLALKKKDQKIEKRKALKIDSHSLGLFFSMLPFRPTRAQERSIAQISEDLQREVPMHRLLQGDVGSGKTLVAAAAASLVLKENQVALMAPTEILAEQHYKNLHRFLSPLGVRLGLLIGDLKGVEKKRLLEEISAGEIGLVVGTHAVIQEAVRFKALALAIVDEQHRFGVMQRAEIKKKGEKPHLLIMTATPIPRTLAMTAYGDLDVSILDELPAGRQSIDTRLYYERDLEKIYRFIRMNLEAGRQAYFVYPLVEESEAMDLKDASQMFEKLKNEVFPDYQVGLLHGKMKGEEKERTLSRFAANEIQVLVATTVIEVGIDVPNANIMIIEHAERFGLSQLHQIRGRVGRGSEKSYCFLIAAWPRSEVSEQRLKIMCESGDGFKIAEADLEIRGPGDFLGTRQSGLPDFRIANLIRDAHLLERARQEAFEYIEKDPALESSESQKLKFVLQHRWKGRLNLSQVG